MKPEMKWMGIAAIVMLAAAPAVAAPFKQAPGPEAGAGLGALLLMISGYLALRRRFGRD